MMDKSMPIIDAEKCGGLKSPDAPNLDALMRVGKHGYTELVYVLIVSGDYGETWHYADVRRTQPEAAKCLMQLQRQNPDCMYRFRTVSQDVFDALFARGEAA